MKKYNIPTAAYEVFFEYSSAKDYIESISEFPIVIKADGLALGKGVIICEDKNSALFTLEEMMLNKKFGSAGDKIVVEEFLTGPEVSVLAFTDGKTIFPMVSSKDHKRALDEDMGLNTGGMGTISPNPYYTKEIESMCMSEIFIPTINAMVKEGRKFKGCLYFGLMITTDGAKVIEYNARFGDPEAQVVLPRLKTPLIDIIDAVIDEKLDEISIDWHDEAAACIIISSGGYPENYEKGYEISGLNSFGQIDDITKVYHSGTVYKDNKFYTNGGRVLGITAMDKTLEKAIEKAYYGVHQVSFKDMHFRKDIGRIK